MANDHSREVIKATQGRVSIIPIGKPKADYITKDEFTEFKESLMERFKAFAGEAS